MNTDRWRREIRLGRWQFSVTVICHHHVTHSDRWVVQTSTVYDRKQR